MDHTPTNFSTLNVAKILKIERERLRDWIDREFIVPSIQKSKRQGDRSLFSVTDIYGIALFRMLVENVKMSRREASVFIKKWHEHPEANIENVNIMTFTRLQGNKIEATWSFIDDEVTKNHKTYIIDIPVKFANDSPWDFILIVNFKKIKNEVDSIL